MEIINAFNNKFDFCPVYFFYNYDTKKIKHKDFKNVFINKNLEIDSSVIFKLDTFLIGEIGYNFQELDTISTTRYRVVYHDQAGKVTTDPLYGTSTDFSNYGFSIRNQEGVLIQKPFPGFTSGYFAFVKRDPKSIVIKLNHKLHRYRERYLN